MSKVICKRLELIHIDDVEILYRGEIKLKRNKSFRQLPIEEKATYSSSGRNEDPGTTLEETVTARIPYTQRSLIHSPLSRYILRLFTNEGSFLVGSPEYPAILSFTHNKIDVNLTFRAVSPQ